MFPIIDDVVYNQSMMNGNTIDKRRPDLRDELGYIAPPNRKLPPVPGSNYNTCDRVKRGWFMGFNKFHFQFSGRLVGQFCDVFETMLAFEKNLFLPRCLYYIYIFLWLRA